MFSVHCSSGQTKLRPHCVVLRCKWRQTLRNAGTPMHRNTMSWEADSPYVGIPADHNTISSTKGNTIRAWELYHPRQVRRKAFRHHVYCPHQFSWLMHFPTSATERNSVWYITAGIQLTENIDLRVCILFPFHYTLLTYVPHQIVQQSGACAQRHSITDSPIANPSSTQNWRE
jgi:hypothetical protein